MAEYHKYIFNSESRTFIGNFEEMYMQEKIANFDSWHQDDYRQLNRKIAINILDEYNFRNILDIGVGKGSLTHLLKKRNNMVLGIDISPTAIEMAKSRFPDIDFDVSDVNNLPNFERYLEHRYPNSEEGIDLVFTSECLSYIENWRGLIGLLSRFSRFMLISLFIPENPIGFVKSKEELEEELGRHFDILEQVYLEKSLFIILFGKNKLIT